MFVRFAPALSVVALSVVALSVVACEEEEICPIEDQRPLDEVAYFDDPRKLQALQAAVPATYTTTATYFGVDVDTEVTVDAAVAWDEGLVTTFGQSQGFDVACLPLIGFPAEWRVSVEDGLLDLSPDQPFAFTLTDEALSDPDAPLPGSLSTVAEIPISAVGGNYPLEIDGNPILSIGIGLFYPLEDEPGGAIQPTVDVGSGVAFGPFGGRTTLRWGSSADD